jgi:hypothetical protein
MSEQTWAEADALWLKDRDENGWSLDGHKAVWPFRLWGIRHIRWLYLMNKVEGQAANFASIGIGFGRPNQSDLWVLYAIRRGWA